MRSARDGWGELRLACELGITAAYSTDGIYRRNIHSRGEVVNRTNSELQGSNKIKRHTAI